MIFLIEIANLAAIKAFLVGIPESIELLAFGSGLIASVVLIRWFLKRNIADKTDEKFNENSLTSN